MTQFVAPIALFSAVFTLVGCGESTPAESTPKAASELPADSPPKVTEEAIRTSLNAADEYLNGGEYGKAQAILAVLVDRAPREVPAREMLGQTLTLMAAESDQAGRPDEAQDLRRQAYEQYRVATEIEPDSYGLQHSAGMIAHAAGLVDEALTHYLEAGRLEPLSPQPPVFAAQVLIAPGRLDEAEAELQRALALDPDEPLVHASLGLIDMQRERYDEALAHIAEARSISPQDPGLLAQEARIRRRAGDPQRAVEMLVGLPDRIRTQEPVTVELALSYDALDRPADAAQAWVTRMQLLGDHPLRWRDATRAAAEYLKAGQREVAWSWLQEAKMLAPNAREVVDLETSFGAR